MVPSIRKQFNDSFTELKYQEYLSSLNEKFKGAIEFRVAETPFLLIEFLKKKFYLHANQSLM